MSFSTWWANVPKKEKPGLLVLMVIVGAAILFGAGVQVGQFIFS